MLFGAKSFERGEIQTALPKILAEELDADWSLVRSQLGTNDAAYVDPLFGMHLTGGSNTIKNSFTQYRELGARVRVRAMLLAAAADRWNVGDERGAVLATDGCKLLYGELAEAAMAMPVPQKIALKDPKDFRIIGKHTPRLDAKANRLIVRCVHLNFRTVRRRFRPIVLRAADRHPPWYSQFHREG
ncbi:hypothetical protein [Phyllobacterium zundukense]|uniref:Uncharacterized protein n=1 Tax=Phyllobacterium zundukense TaxID=1867719 RepID=A0ACD4D8I2_9HYPH|nr:hypothetical protein [Phyllobacterium zundukense]UXN62059.1 hypothetical protein N8E88_18750 [Phyllobacterium zundukense]